MSENIEELKKQIHEAVKTNFSTNTGINNFFNHVLDGFAHRYLKDDKSSEAILETFENKVYQVSTVTVSMKKALELVNEMEKAALINNIKDSMNNTRATTLFQIKVVATDLNNEGKGKILSYAIINWDFPNHQNTDKGLFKEFSFQSADWDQLRKEFPLFLEEVCQEF